MTLRPSVWPAALAPLLVVSLGAQTQLSPVPADWVSDTTLTASGHNFSITAPAGWTWQQGEISQAEMGKVVVFLTADDVGANRFLVMVAQISTPRSSQRDAEQLASGMAKTMPPGWNRTGDVQVMDSAIPVAGSSLIRTKISGPDRRELFMYWYLIPGRESYYVLVFSPESTEPAQFTAFARSFHFIDPSKNVSNVDESSRAVMGIIFWWALGAAIVDWRYVRRGGTRSRTKEKVALGMAVPLCVGLLFVLALVGVRAEALGGLLVSLMIGVLACWQLRRFFVRRAHPVAKQPPATFVT